MYRLSKIAKDHARSYFTFDVIRLTKCAFLTPKKSGIFLKIRLKILSIRSFDVFALILFVIKEK